MEVQWTQRVAHKLNIPLHQVNAVMTLVEGGNTVPFIARYRKEATQNLDEVAISDIITSYKQEDEMASRKLTILAAISEQGKLTDELRQSILTTFDPHKLEDLYAPFKKKRKTKADMAREWGLEPLAKIIMSKTHNDIYHEAEKYINEFVFDSEMAIAKAQDIIIEWIAETEDLRDRLRETHRRYGVVGSKVVASKKQEALMYKDYFERNEKLDKCPSHRYLAMLRGEEEGYLRLSFAIDIERVEHFLQRIYVRNNGRNTEIIEKAISTSVKEYILPAVETQIRKEYKERADAEAIKVFATNLEQLLLAAPLGGKSILAIDPGFRTGCKVACISAKGDFLYHTVIYPTEPFFKSAESKETVSRLMAEYGIKVIAIGNGTASRDVKYWVESCAWTGISVFIVSESGASIYSASEVAREEFPDLDLTVRGAISIGRRLLDPLAELIKSDPKSIGVGQYQHDVNQVALREKLDNTVISCVNKVGIDLNTTSKHLLAYISGLGPVVAQNIIEYRQEIGGYITKEQLLEVPRLGQKAFQQCAGFLRIRQGHNPLDNTGIHPEAYKVVDKIALQVNAEVKDLIGNTKLLDSVDTKAIEDTQFGKETISDIIKELKKPGHDPRGEAEVFEFDKNVRSLDDIQAGMKLNGIVTNLTNFGAFVDIGVKQDGMIHISKMSKKRIQNPSEVLSLSQKVLVTVLDVDISRKRINLTLLDH